MASFSAKLVAACGLLVGVPLTVTAGVLIDAGPASTNQTFTTGNYVAGSEFTITAPVTIKSLGWLDAEGNGLTISHQIGLWSVATQALLVSGTVTPTSPSIPSAHGVAKWFMVNVADTVLPPGTYRVAGEVSGDNIALTGNKIPGPGVTITAGYIRTDFPSGGFAYPNLTFASEAVRATVSDEAAGGPALCYANCDASTIAPVLNVNDFTCFLNQYAAGVSYANCDASTIPPVLNVNDFTCFINRYAAGCI